MSPTTSNRRSPHSERLAIREDWEQIETDKIGMVYGPNVRELSNSRECSTFCYGGTCRLVHVPHSSVPAQWHETSSNVSAANHGIYAFISPQTFDALGGLVIVELGGVDKLMADHTLSADPVITDPERLKAHWDSFKMRHGGQVIPGDYRWHKANQGQREARVLASRPWAGEYLLEYVMPKGTSSLVICGGATGEARRSVSYGKLPKYWVDRIMQRHDAIPSDGCLPHGFEWGNPQQGDRATVVSNLGSSSTSVRGDWRVERYSDGTGTAD